MLCFEPSRRGSRVAITTRPLRVRSATGVGLTRFRALRDQSQALPRFVVRVHPLAMLPLTRKPEKVDRAVVDRRHPVPDLSPAFEREDRCPTTTPAPGISNNVVDERGAGDDALHPTKTQTRLEENYSCITVRAMHGDCLEVVDDHWCCLDG